MYFLNRIYQLISPEVESIQINEKLETNPQQDVVMIVGPNSPGLKESFERNAEAAGLAYEVIGDGINPVTQQMVLEARSKGIIGPDTEVFCHFHGNIPDDNPSTHLIELTDSGKADVSTEDFLGWLRKPLPTGLDSGKESTPWKGTINLLSCHSGNLRNVISPDSELWQQGNLLVHASRKDTLTDVGMANFGELVRLLGECKRNGMPRPDGMEMLRHLTEVSGDTVSLLGGELQEILSVPAPKCTEEAMPGYLEEQWRQQEAWSRLAAVDEGEEGRPNIKDRRPIKGALEDIEKFMDGKKLSTSESNTNIKFKNVIFTRVGRGKEAKLESDLTKFKDGVHFRDSKGNTLLLIACTNKLHIPDDITKNRELVKFLITKGSNVDAQDNFGNSALHHVCHGSDVPLAKILLEYGKARADIANREGWIPLHNACFIKKQNINMVNLLLSKQPPTSINKCTEDGRTALHLAVQAGRSDLVELLIQAGASTSIKDNLGRTPLKIALTEKKTDIAEYLADWPT